MSAEIYLVIAGFVKIGAVETILYLGEWMKFYPYFFTFILDLDEIRYERSAQKSVERLWFSWKFAQGMAVLMGVNENTFTQGCTNLRKI
jgi:hypothetical protein